MTLAETVSRLVSLTDTFLLQQHLSQTNQNHSYTSMSASLYNTGLTRQQAAYMCPEDEQ